MRIVLVHNPGSGDDDHAREDLVRLIAGAGHDVSHHSSKSGWQAQLDSKPDLVVAAGGDGTVAEVARSTAGTGIPVAVLPTGTANNIASWLGVAGIPHDELIASWAEGTLQPFDLGIADGPWGGYQFLESVGVGVLARMMADIEHGGSRYVNELDARHERITAALELLERVLAETEPTRCEISIDGVVFSGEYLLVEILNFGLAGPNLRLAAQADGGDGVLDVVLVEARDRARLEAHVSKMRADPASAPMLPARHGRRVTLTCEPCAVHLDDELWPEGGKVAGFTANATVVPAALTFVVPPGVEQRRLHAPARRGVS